MPVNKKYEFTGETKDVEGRLVRRIRHTVTGRLGGWIAGEHNLSHAGTCWVYDNAVVMDRARVQGHAHVTDMAVICGNATVTGAARIRNRVKVGDSAHVGGSAHVRDECKILNRSKIDGRVRLRGQVCASGSCHITDHAYLSGRIRIRTSARISDNVAVIADASLNPEIPLDRPLVTICGPLQLQGNMHLRNGFYSTYDDILYISTDEISLTFTRDGLGIVLNSDPIDQVHEWRPVVGGQYKSQPLFGGSLMLSNTRPDVLRITAITESSYRHLTNRINDLISRLTPLMLENEDAATRRVPATPRRRVIDLNTISTERSNAEKI